MTSKKIRELFLSFFGKKNHAILPSASLLPENDPTTLFTGSGMQPILPYLLGEAHPQGKRLANSQKSFRTQDIETIGDNRHTTFFEMLGNWSLGDYFKAEQIPWIWEFLTSELSLDPHRLLITCFRGNDSLGIPRDEESAMLWKKLMKKSGINTKIGEEPEKEGVHPGQQIFYYSEEKNWWSRSGKPSSMPVGEPGGPDSEIFWDFGSALKMHEQSQFKDQRCHVNCDCGRFMEIGNNVFMEYRKNSGGFEKLPQRNVDFGGGLERTSAAVNDQPDIFLIDLFQPLLRTIEKCSGKKYGENRSVVESFRVILDHLRAATFLIADGAEPENKDQGYFTRRLLRRSIRTAKKIGIQKSFCAESAASVIDVYLEPYPELLAKRDRILKVMDEEEAKFERTINEGLKKFEQLASKVQSSGEISGEEAFDLYQSYGFPIEMTRELAKEKGFVIDEGGWKKAAIEHQGFSRKGSEQKFKGGLADSSQMSTKFHTATHLLHQALRNVLGPHVEQRGSNITPERLRFDFTHIAKMGPEEIQKVEELVNVQIQKNLPVHCERMTVEEAKKKGAIGLFEERYGEKVNVYRIGDFSMEICGGPHVERTGLLGHFKIIKESSSSSGVRRIKAILERRSTDA